MHEIGAREGVRRSHYSTASFPMIESASWSQARIRQSVLRLENDQTIILGSLDLSEPCGPHARDKLYSQAYLEKVRPPSWPRPPRNGLNRVLPSSQIQNHIPCSSAGSVQVPGLHDVLESFHEKTGKLYLSEGDIRCIMNEKKKFITLNSKVQPVAIRKSIAACYKDVLQKKRLTYENQSYRKLRLLFLILWVFAHLFFESGLILGELLQWAAVDWRKLLLLKARKRYIRLLSARKNVH